MKILMISPNATDGVSLYRHWGPMIELEKQGHCQLIASPEENQITHWQYYKKAHIAFFHRPARLWEQAKFMECQKFGLPIWTDIDDNIFTVPDDNQAFDFYNETAQKIVLQALKKSNVVTVATQRLQDFLKKMFEIDSIIIPNALDDSLKRFKKEFSKNRRIMWRGSQASFATLLYYAPAFTSFIKQNPEYRWTFFGLNPFFISRGFSKPNIFWQKSVNFQDYIHSITDFNPSITVMTHFNTEFDATKSTNGWLEATLAGSVCLVPNLGDWSKLSDDMVFKYSPMDPNSLLEKLIQMTKTSENKLKEMHDKSWNFISEELVLSRINQKRLQIIGGLKGGS